jgi:drug/metabolite transporter (DMT)-like permease
VRRGHRGAFRRRFAIGIESLPGVFFALAPAVLLALGTILLKLIALPPFAAVAWQLVIGCTPMIVLGLLFEHPRFDALSPRGVGLMA